MAMQSTIRFVSAVFKTTGGFANQVMRPYETHMNNDVFNSFADAISSINPHNQPSRHGIDGRMFGSLAAEALKPSATAGEVVTIANGWSSPRLSFAIMVEVIDNHSTSVHTLQGFTDCFDPSIINQSNLDPNMTLYINSVSVASRTVMATPHGMQEANSMIHNSHLLVNRDWGDLGTAQYHNQGRTVPVNLRPVDVFSQLTLSDTPIDSRLLGNAFDVRNSRTGVPAFSRRTNCLPSQYVGRLLNDYQKAQHDHFGSTVYTQALSFSQEDMYNKNELLRRISSHLGENNVHAIRWGDLCRIVQGLNERAVVTIDPFIDYTQRADNLFNSGSQARDLNVQIATLLFSAVPAMMAYYGMATAVFVVSNRNMVNGLITPYLEFVSNPTAYNGLDLSMILPLFSQRVINEIMNAVSQHNLIDYHVEMHCFPHGETKLNIATAGIQVPTPFVFPSFADSLNLPVLANDRMVLDGLSADFGNVFNQLLPQGPRLEDLDGNYYQAGYNQEV